MSTKGIALIVPQVWGETSLGKVTFDNPTPYKMSIISQDVIVGATYQFNLASRPIHIENTDVTWSIEEGASSGVTISNSGLITIPDGVIETPITVKAVLKSDPTFFSVKDVIVNYSYIPVGYVNEGIYLNGSEPIKIVKATSTAQKKERIVYTTAGVISYKSLDPDNVSEVLEDNMYLIKVPDGATSLQVSGDNLTFCARNIAVFQYNEDVSGQVTEKVTIAQSPQTVLLHGDARNIYIRIEQGENQEYVCPTLNFIYT